MVKFSVKKPLTIFVAVLAVIILGVVAFMKMTPDLLPNMDFPYVVIMTAYPGASPESVEEEVTKPLEQSMATLEHIQRVSSNSSENYSVVTLEFEDSVNMDTVGVDIQQNIAALQGTWPDAVATPYVLKINPSLLPVEVAAVAMEGMDNIELTDFVESALLPKLEGVTGVARVTTMGAVTRQVHVVISEDKIDAVNERLRTGVNDRLDAAAAELQDTRAELEDARGKLDEAGAQLDTGRDALVSQTASAEAALSQQQIAALQGRMELQEQLDALNNTRAQLSATLAVAQPILENLEALESGRQSLETQIAALNAAQEQLAAADEAMSAYADELAAIEADETLTDEEKAEAAAAITESEDYIAAAAAVDEAEQALADLGTSRYELPAAIVTAETALAQTEAQLSAVDATLASMELTREDLPDTVAQLQSGIAQADEGAAMLQDALDQVDAGTMQIADAVGLLSQSKSEGLLQLADAAAQLAANSAALDSALSQVDSGLTSIEDSRESALASADISGSLTLTSVSAILSAQNFSMPAGYVEQNGVGYMVSVGDEMTDPEELGRLLVFDAGEDSIGPVYLRDVADVFVTDNADETYAKLDGTDGLILTFEKQSNAATADVTGALNDRFRSLERQYDGLSFVPLMDQGSYIHLIISSILQSLYMGAIFAIIVLILFLRDIRPTVITLVSIPVSVVFAFVLMYFSGVTLNMISLSGLAVAVGMLVDNSIVVIENIYRLRRKGATPAQAAVAGTRQVAGAITASTLTTVCVFLPIVFVEGITRQLFTDLALTMGYSLMASLLIALTLVPAMSRGMLRTIRAHRTADGEGRFARGYRAVISWCLGHKWVVLPLALALLLGSAYLALSRGFSYMPEADVNTVNIQLTMPEDATRADAVAAADEALSRISSLDHVETVGAMMGGASLLRSSDSYDVTVYVTLAEGESGEAAGRRIEELCADLPCEVTHSSSMMSMSMLTGTGVSVNVYGNDMQALQTAAQDIADALNSVPGLENADPGLEDAVPAIHVEVDRNAAMQKGYTVAQLYTKIAAALTDSSTALRMDMDGVTADVLVETGGAMNRHELSGLAFSYTDEDGNDATFRLREVARLRDTVSLSSIRRDEQRRYVAVTADVSEGQNVTLAAAEAQKAVAALTLPAGVTYEFDGENEEILEAVRQLGLMLLLGVVLVYFVMVAQFQSLKGPFIVMFTIPLAFTGGFLALLICGMDVSVISLIGFVMLTGIIVNNGIVLIDYVNQLRAEGTEKRAALVEAGVTRLRPILMTSLTTILGLIVMALGNDAGTALMQPVAVVCIGGLLYATLMTLIVVPCIYDLMNRKELSVVRDEELEFEEE